MDNVNITCPLCGYSKEVPAESLPKVAFRIKCPKCQQASIHNPPGTTEPSPPPAKPRIKAICPHCGLVKEVAEGVVAHGAPVTCPQCRKRFTFPGALPDEPAKAEPPPEQPPEQPVKTPPPQPSEPAPHPADDGNDPGEFRAAPAPVAASASATARKRAALSDIGELFGRSWEVYKKRVFVLLALMVVSGIMFAVPFGLLFGLGALFSMVLPANKGAMIVLCTLAGGMAGIAGGMWGVAAFLSAVVDEGLDFMGSFKQGKPLILPLLWLMIVTCFIIFGGYMFFIIPGLVFTLWFLFAQLILADGRGVGMDALLSSRALGKGHWLGILGRFIVVWLASVVVSAIPILGIVLSLLFTPFMLIYICQMYEDLKEMRGEEAFLPHPGESWRLVGAAVMGYLIVPVLLVAFLVSFSVKHGVTIKEALMSQAGIGDILAGAEQAGLTPAGEEKMPEVIGSGELAGQVTQAITAGSFESTVKTDKMTYAPGEAVKVTFTAPASYPDNAWIGIIPNDIPHGDEAVNDQHDIEYQYISKRTAGEMTFTAPSRPGRYDIRMHDTDNNGKEVAFTWFEVAEGGSGVPSQGQPPQASPTTTYSSGSGAKRLHVYICAQLQGRGQAERGVLL